MYNSRARFALEIACVVLAALFLAVESLDFLQWSIGVYKRRSLMRSASKYKPPLYPIPGGAYISPREPIQLGAMIGPALAAGPLVESIGA